ncbi:TIGR02186 family protein [uncultured Paracoccus sp.]|uniref:TIGR02186 family protein n=1 Tax=uncultured Paracoccus sp. TaxID=189685 RepID=UPI0025F0EAE8|nr:TIGR02186 family protein [uncultured Paracoccus sp.]
MTRPLVPLLAALALFLPGLVLSQTQMRGGFDSAQTPSAPRTEQVVAGISQDDVHITTNFDGSDIIIYGAIKRETPIPPGEPLDVIVAVQGPAKSVTIRRKEQRFGVWVNTDSVSIGAAPDFYVVATTRPLDRILPPEQDARHRVSIPQAVRAFAGALTVSDAVPFTEALLRLREQAGLYRLDEGVVTLVEQTLFRADVRMPANVVEGIYSARILLLRDGEVIDTYRAPIEVRKVGLERWLYHMALEQPFIYGIMSLAIAIAAGWLASAAFRGLKRG